MADLTIEGSELVLRLSATERVEALHRDLRVPLSSVAGVEVVEDAHRAADVLGVKVGTRIPRSVEVATVYRPGAKLFAAVHRGTPRGLRITLRGASEDEWVVGCADPEAVRSEIESALTGCTSPGDGAARD